MIKTIHFDNILAKETNTKSIRLDVDSPASLLNGLRSQVPNFRQMLIKYPSLSIILANKDHSSVNAVTPDTYKFPLGDTTSDIYVLSPISGAGVEAVAYLIMEYELSLAVASAIVYVATAFAVNIVIGLVMNVLAPSADTSGGGAKVDERPSFLYNGAINVIEQGYAVPIVYGTHMTGSIVVSAGVDITEMPYDTSQDTAPANGGGTPQPMFPAAEIWQAFGEGGE